MENVTFRCTSISPLLMNNPASMLVQTKKVRGQAQEHDPAEEAEAGAYRFDSGHLYFPTLAFRRACIDAGAGRKVAGTRQSAKTILNGALFLPDEGGDSVLDTPLLDPDTDEPLEKYEVDVRRCVVQGRSAIIRGRPRLDEWAAYVTFQVDDARISLDHMTSIFEIAGSSIGIGNWRPQKGGIFGRFAVERIKS